MKGADKLKPCAPPGIPEDLSSDGGAVHSPDGIAVRRATAADAHLLASLGRQTFWDSFATDNHPADMTAYLQQAFGPDTQAAELADPASRFLIAQAHDRPIGYAHLMDSQHPACIQAQRPTQLSRFYATRDWIGRGVGTALMRACLDDAQRRSADGIWLGVWEKNSRAIRFYQHWGFRPVGTQPFVLGTDRQNDMVMWLPFDQYHPIQPANR
jgi:GNAT superfamily N-acetyltransferase